ncbi:MAG: hypothetical protein N3D75_02625 [Candidatus Aenigmarchaeota archaeon]|nr:hypothetical protein [Candidatus Aenigmarchaeota archaeon]
MQQISTYIPDNMPDVSVLYTRMNEAKVKGDEEEIKECIACGIRLGHYDVIEHGYQSLEITKRVKNGEIDPKDRFTLWKLEKIKPPIPEEDLKKAFPNAYRIRGCDFLHIQYTSISKIYRGLYGEDFNNYCLNGKPYYLLDEDEKRIVNEYLIREKLSLLGYQ